ncbi:hypothetical protein [Nostoc favosum]|uniref:Uncharacterized protein n=1 Tax=Nostoc favosum CHAB5714 TaxID=2780399 RepID=A0ABS8IJH7_9NOSO|nr:hypothetical protein [Nostoc favosum]MCC5604435.1 hypothetical protein [Nostoc favosum CHAB5714]
MPVEAISLRTGLELPAAIADFDTYIDELPRCSKCFGELCLAKGEKMPPYWRHFPGVGNQCPDKSEISGVIYSHPKTLDRKQTLALFKKRFLEILDIAINGTLTIDGLFATRQLSEQIKGSSVQCSNGIAHFNDCLLEIDRLRKNLDCILAVASSCAKNLYSNDSINEWKVPEAEKIQMLEITIAYKQTHERCVDEACKYIYSNGRQDLLKELVAFAWLEYNSKLKNTYNQLKVREFPVWLLTATTSILAAVPWYRIMTALLEEKEPHTQPLSIFALPNNLDIIFEVFLSSKKPPTKPQGFMPKKSN